MSRIYRNIDYPIEIRKVGDKLTFFMRDLGIAVGIPLETLSSEMIGSKVIQLLKMGDQEIKERIKHGKPLPKPSPSREKPSPESITVRVMAKRLGVSESTVRRMADNGAIKCEKTPGGHRKFPVSPDDQL